MPVSVSMPIKLRVDRTALAAHPCWIEDAVSAAVGRAMANSRKSVLDARGGFVGVCLHQPTFSWSGHPLTARDREQLEQLVTNAIVEAARREGVGADLAAPGVAPVLPDDPYEIYDDDRGLRFLDEYNLDSYDGGNEDVRLTRKKPLSLFEDVDILRVIEAPDDPAINEKLDALAAKATQSQPLGIIFRYAAPGVPAGWQVIITNGQQVVGLFNFPAFYALQFQGPTADPMFRNVPYVPSVGPSTAELIDLPADPGQRREVLKKLFGDDYAWAVRRRFPKPVSLTTPKYNALIEDSVAKNIDGTLTKISAVAGAVKVTMGGAKNVLWFTEDNLENVSWLGTARLTPLTERTTRLKTQKKKAGGEPGGTGTESTLMFPRENTGTGDCPKDLIDKDKWGGFMNEPALDEIGDAGELFGKRMTEIAGALGIETGNFAGEFCSKAAGALKDKADAVTDIYEGAVGENKAAAAGNMGAIDFTPGESAIITTVRDYAAILHKIAELVRLINDTFSRKEYACAIHGMYRGNGAGWSLHFLEEVVPTMKWVVYHLFVGGCRSMLIQLLVTSENEIKKRQAAMDRYAPLFEKWILPEITDLAELETMEKNLTEYQRTKYAQKAMMPMVTSGAAGQDWLLATSALVAVIGGPAVTRAQGQLYDIVDDGGIDKIRGSNGVLWSKDDLVQAMAIKRKTAEGIDPLVKQITDTPDAVKRFKQTSDVRTELEKLLAEMLADNQEMQVKAANQPMYGFGASSRNQNTANATVPYSSYQLGGIHLLTHQAIGDAFGGSRIYGTGLDFLFDSEEGKASLKGFGLMVGMIALAVLVPGGGFLAFGVGVAAAKHELDVAYEKKRLYRALIDPDKVLSYAEVEVGLFVAWFGFVLSLVPEAGTATKGLISGGKAVLKGEAKQIGTMAGRAIAKAAAKELAEYAVKDLLEAFVKETIVNIVMGEIIQQVMSPLIEEMSKEASIIRPGADGGGGDGDDGGEHEFIVMIRSSEVL